MTIKISYTSNEICSFSYWGVSCVNAVYNAAALPEETIDQGPRKLFQHHDKTRPHVEMFCLSFIIKRYFHCSHPAYSLNLGLCDFWLFSTIKKELKGNRFARIHQNRESNLQTTFDSRLGFCIRRLANPLEYVHTKEEAGGGAFWKRTCKNCWWNQ